MIKMNTTKKVHFLMHLSLTSVSKLLLLVYESDKSLLNLKLNASSFLFQNLLDKERKTTNRGTSESTSGCESGQNYESDEMDNVSAQSGSRHPSSEGDSGNVRNSPYVMQGNIGPNPASDIAEGKRLFLKNQLII